MSKAPSKNPDNALHMAVLPVNGLVGLVGLPLNLIAYSTLLSGLFLINQPLLHSKWRWQLVELLKNFC